MGKLIASHCISHCVQGTTAALPHCHRQAYPDHSSWYSLSRSSINHRSAEGVAATAKLKSGHEGLLHRDIGVIPLRIIHITYHRLERRLLDGLLGVLTLYFLRA